MNTEYLWWLLALLLAGGGTVAFLALGRIPEIEDEPAAERAGGQAEEPARPAEPDQSARDIDQGAAAEAADGSAYSTPVSTTVPGPGAPFSTSDTP